VIVENIFRNRSPLNSLDEFFVPITGHNALNTHYSEIIFIDSFNLFIAFDYLPNWRQHPPHNEVPIAFGLFVFWPAGMHPGDRPVNVAMRCRPSI